MYVADGEFGVEVLPRQCQLTTAVLPDETVHGQATLGLAIPNPLSVNSATIPFTMHHSGPAKLRIIDTSGGEVRVLLDRPLTAGEHSATWDGRNAAGELLPVGVYFYQLVIPGYQATRKLVRVR